jgi:hypothetical protein
LWNCKFNKHWKLYVVTLDAGFNFFGRSTDHERRVMKNESFLAYVDKRLCVEIDSAASRGSQGKCRKEVYLASA